MSWDNIIMEDKKICLRVQDCSIPFSYENNDKVIDYELMATYCRLLYDFVLAKSNIVQIDVSYPTFIVSKVQNQIFAVFEDIQIIFAINDGVIKIYGFYLGNEILKVEGSYDSVRDNFDEGIKVKKLAPLTIGTWRKKGFRPMYFKGKAYLMLKGDYLPSFSIGKNISLGQIANALKQCSEILKTYGKSVNNIYKVAIRKKDFMANCQPDENDEITIRIVEDGIFVIIAILVGEKIIYLKRGFKELVLKE